MWYPGIYSSIYTLLKTIHLLVDVDAEALQELPALARSGRFSVGNPSDRPPPHEPLLALRGGKVQLKHEVVHRIRHLQQ